MIETLVQAAVKEPVSLALAKQYLRVTHSLEDAVIGSMISSARKLCEDACRISIAPQRWKAQYRLPQYKNDCFGLLPRIEDPERIKDRMALPRPPVTQINSVTLIDQFTNSYPFTSFVLDADNNQLGWTDPRIISFGFDWGNYIDMQGGQVSTRVYGPNGEWPRAKYIEVDFMAGYPLWSTLYPGTSQPKTQADVIIPPDLTQAVLLVLASLYENRGDDDTTIPKKALLALRPYFYSTRSAG